MKQILVLGGAGFVGSHLVDRLLLAGHVVTVVDHGRFCHADNLAPHPRLVRVGADCAADDWAVPDDAFDEIYHLAGLASTELFLLYPLEAFYATVLPFKKVGDYVRKHGAAGTRVLYTSSSEVYGSPSGGLMPETLVGAVSTTNERAGYSEGKRAGEAQAAAYRQQVGMRVATVRIFNTFGPRQMAHDLVPSVIRRLLCGEPIRIHRPGTQTRTLLYVDDLVEGILGAMQRQWPEPINLGGSQEMSVLEIVKLIGEAAGIEPQIEMVEGLSHDIERRRPLLALAASELGWRPRTPVIEGLRRTVEYWGLRLERENADAVAADALSGR